MTTSDTRTTTSEAGDRQHVLLLTENFYPSVSGGAHARWRFARIATERGHRVSVVTPRNGDVPRRETVDGVEIRRPFPSRPAFLPEYAPLAFLTRLLYTALLSAYLLWWVPRREVTGVYSASNTSHGVATLLGTVYDLPAVNFVGYAPSLDADRGPKVWLERLTYRFLVSPVVLCRVPAVKTAIERRNDVTVELAEGVLDREKITAAAGADLAARRRELGVEADGRLFAVVGRLSPLKNVAAAVDAFADLPETDRLVVVGDGPQRETIRGAARRHGVTDRVTLLGECPHEEALVTIASADGLFLSSRTEAYPTVVFEGLALGCEVFSTPVGVVPQVEHDRLHVGPVESFPDLVADAAFADPPIPDEAVLEQYSLERLATRVLDGLAAQRTDTDA